MQSQFTDKAKTALLLAGRAAKACIRIMLEQSISCWA